jgi:hypothetical protein
LLMTETTAAMKITVMMKMELSSKTANRQFCAHVLELVW